VTSGSLSQTKYVQAGSGFLSQHTKELFFGLGDYSAGVKATIHWPSGLKQQVEDLPVNHRIEIDEGSSNLQARRFADSAGSPERSELIPRAEVLPSTWGTWLIEPVTAPDFSLADLSGNLRELGALQGKFVLLTFWSTNSLGSRESLDILRKGHAPLVAQEVQVLAVNVDESQDARKIESFLRSGTLPFPVLLATSEMAGVYNIIYRYLFDRHRDLAVPLHWLIDPSGKIIKTYHGPVDPEQVLRDVASTHLEPADRLRKALPFPGILCRDEFRRNAHTYGVAFFQHGFLKEAEAAFQQAVAANPQDADAFYNLGTLYLRRNSTEQAHHNLEQAVKLRPSYVEAWNNLGMLAAER